MPVYDSNHESSVCAEINISTDAINLDKAGQFCEEMDTKCVACQFFLIHYVGYSFEKNTLHEHCMLYLIWDFK